jgi:hypothetical protein
VGDMVGTDRAEAKKTAHTEWNETPEGLAPTVRSAITRANPALTPGRSGLEQVGISHLPCGRLRYEHRDAAVLLSRKADMTNILAQKARIVNYSPAKPVVAKGEAHQLPWGKPSGLGCHRV